MSELPRSQPSGEGQVLERFELDLRNPHLTRARRTRVPPRQLEALEQARDARSHVVVMSFWLWTQWLTHLTIDGVSVEEQFAGNLRRLRQAAGLALEVLHELTEISAPASLGRALIYDLRTMEVTREAVPRFADCPVCG